MTFSKFMVSYYLHFHKMFSALDYGFSDLTELFKAFPSVLEVKEAVNDKTVCLVKSLQLQILAERIIAVIKAQPNKMIDISQLYAEYAHMHQFKLQPKDFGCRNLSTLLEQLKYCVKIISYDRRYHICLLHHDDTLHQISLNIRHILMQQSKGEMSLANACYVYEQYFGRNENLIFYLKQMPDIIKIDNGYLQLTPLQLLARNIIILLQENLGQIPLSAIKVAFLKRFGFPLCPAKYHLKNMCSLVIHLYDYFELTEKKKERFVQLRYKTAVYASSIRLEMPVNSSSSESSLIEKQNARDAAYISQPWFAYRPLQVNAVQTFATPFMITSTKPMSHIYSSSMSTIPSIISPEITTNLSMDLAQNTVRKHEIEAIRFHQNFIEQQNSSVINVPTMCTSKHDQVPSINLNTVSSAEKKSVYEQLENLVLTTLRNDKSSVLEAGKNYASNSNCDSSGYKHQKRRSRIAAKFSVPID